MGNKFLKFCIDLVKSSRSNYVGFVFYCLEDLGIFMKFMFREIGPTPTSSKSNIRRIDLNISSSCGNPVFCWKKLLRFPSLRS